jgi:hypothetical protein
MIEVVALMIGEVVQCYSDVRYENPQPIKPGMLLRRGQPKSLYRPGSSTDVVVFQPGRNLTYYGFFQANACTLGAALMLALMSFMVLPHCGRRCRSSSCNFCGWPYFCLPAAVK